MTRPRALTLTHRALTLGPSGLVDLVVMSVLGTVVEIGVRLWPLPRVARLLRVRIHGAPPGPTELATTPTERRQRRIVEMMSRHWPFVDHDGLCLRRSLLLGWVYRKRDPLLRVGVARANGAMTAHAWIELEGKHIGADGIHRALDLPPPSTGRRRRSRTR